MIRLRAVGAVAMRQLASYLANPLGYVFIFAFVVISGAFCFMPDSFFQRNIVDLGNLHQIMPLLMAILVPAFAMGAWTLEREYGTDELLLTMPLGMVDAVLGKFLAVACLVLIALLCSLSHAVVLIVLGEPDLGLLLSTYLLWLAYGLAYAALGLAASILVRSASIAFVLGVVACSLSGSLVYHLGLGDGYQQGILSLGAPLLFVGLILAGLGVGTTVLAARRWRSAARSRIAIDLINGLLLLLLIINAARIAQRHDRGWDISAAQLSTLSPDAQRVCAGLEQPVTVHAFLSAELPVEFQARGERFLSTLASLERLGNERLHVQLHRPTGAFDAEAERLGISAEDRRSQGGSGSSLVSVFFGAVVTCGGAVQRIPFLAPGQSAEYELLRAIRSVDVWEDGRRPVIGIAITEVPLGGWPDRESGQMLGTWAIVEELRHQYEVREVPLDLPVLDSQLSVLLVPMPSGLSAEELLNLNDWICAGGKTVLFVEPYLRAHYEGTYAAPGLAPRPRPGISGPDGQPLAKGAVEPLLAALGIDCDLGSIAWAEDPPQEFALRKEQHFVWAQRRDEEMGRHVTLSGLEHLCFPFPAALHIRKDAQATVEPLIAFARNASWGVNRYTHFFDLVQKRARPHGRPIPLQRVDKTSVPKPYAALAVRGHIPRPWAAGPMGQGKAGAASEKPVDVVVISDVDFVADEIVLGYRNTDMQAMDGSARLLANLGNVPFLLNVVDHLAGDESLIGLRGRRPGLRNILSMEAVRQDKLSELRAVSEAATATAMEAKARAQKRYQERLAEITSRPGLSPSERASLRRAVESFALRQRDKQIQEIDRELRRDERAIELRLDSALADFRSEVRIWAVGLPAIILAALLVLVTLIRLINERRQVPVGRRRRQA